MSTAIRIWIVAGLLLSSTAAFAQTRQIRVEVTPNNKKEFRKIVQSNLDVVHVHDEEIEILASQAELDQLVSQGMKTQIINPNVYGPRDGGNWLPEYLSYSEVEALLNSLATTYPDLTELTVIGTSIEGRNIYALKISDNASSDEDEAEILFVGNHHAREVITPIICMHIAETLLGNYGTDPTFTDWVDNREIWIVPILNPDGYYYVETVNLFWRKNRRDSGDGEFGVDLNRNWGFEWGHDDIGSSPNTDSSTYRGTGPFSEPETDALRNFVNTRDFKIALSYHSFGNLLLWGPGYKPADSPDQDIFAGFGNVIASQNGYTVGNQAAGTIYLVNGEATDWLYNDAGIIAFTPEVGSGSDYFNPPANRIPVLVQEGSIIAWEAINYGARLGQLAPPGQPLFNNVEPNAGTYSVTWNPPIDGDTEVIEYELVEKTGPVIAVDGAEDGDVNFDLGGWSISSQRAAGGTFSFFGGTGDHLNRVCLAKAGYLVQPGDDFVFNAWFDLETDYDYAYAIISTDGGRSYSSLQGSFTTMDDPNGRNADHGITGNSNGWHQLTFDLGNYVGQTVWLGFRYSTDRRVNGDGIWIDNVQPVQAWSTTNTLASDITDTQFQINDNPPGTYYYTLRGFDAEGVWGYSSEYTAVVVEDQFVAVPSDFDVTRGQLATGALADLYESDNMDVVLFRLPTDVQSRTELEVESSSPVENPSSMTIVLEGSVFARSQVDQTIELFNYTDGQWEQVDSRSATRFNDSVVEIDITGDVARFVESGPRSIRARVRYESLVARQQFSSGIDQFIWIIEN